MTQTLKFESEVDATLILCCIDEIQYWQDMDFHPFFVDEKGKLQQYSDSEKQVINSKLNSEFRKSIATKKQKMVKMYSEIKFKLMKGDKEFTEEEVHWIKIMCQESIPKMSRCLVVKQQIDGSLTPKSVPKLLNIAFETSKTQCIGMLRRVANELSNIDTIPGEGMGGPRAFTLEGGSLFGDKL